MFQRLKSLFRDLKVWQKLTFITVTALVPATILAYFFVADKLDRVAFAKKEQAGLEYLRLLRELVEYFPQHRGMANGLLSGDATFEQPLTANESAIEDTVTKLDAADQRLGAALGTTDRWGQIRSKWQALKEQYRSLKPPDSFARHTELIADVLQQAAEVGESSNLILDPESEGYYLADSLVRQIVLNAEIGGQARGFGTGVAARKVIMPEEKATLGLYQGQLKITRDVIQRNVNAAGRNDPGRQQRLKVLVRDNLTATTGYIDTIDREFLKAKAVTVVPRNYFDQGTRVIDTSLKLYDAVEPELAGLLQSRLDGLWRNIYLATGSLAAGMFLTVAIVFWITRGITRQVAALMGLFQQVGIGNFEARTEVMSQDELGTVAATLNAMLDNTMSLMQTGEERDAIQASIQKLLEETSGLAEGDLTRDAEVTTDIMGAVADSFNYMSGELRQVIGNVQEATTQVSSSAMQIQTTVRQLAEGSQSQSAEIVNVTSAIDEMAVSIQQVSENTVKSAGVARQALANARQGADAVNNSIEGMGRIRDQAQETAKRIKRLGESSQEIGQITQLIDDIADRTSILALNASIQAAMAGDAGRGFAVVAEEVERLAMRATEATKKIDRLVKTIQGEANEAVSSMEKGIQEVVEGSKLASQAGQTLTEIEGVSNQLAELIQSISLATKQQARAAEGIAKSMTDISQVTQDVAAGNDQAAVAVSHMAALVDGLHGSVSRFRLPQRNGPHERADGRDPSPADGLAGNGRSAARNGPVQRTSREAAVASV